MELIVFAAAAVGILALIALMSPGVERDRRPIRTMVGEDQRTRRLQRASMAAQMAQRDVARPLRVSGEAVAPRPPQARPVAQPRNVNQRERNADGLVASLLGPTAQAS